VATFLGAANLLRGVIKNRKFEFEDIKIKAESETTDLQDGQPATLVFRPEDVFLRKPENLVQNYQKLTEATVEEVNFVGAFERVVVKLRLSKPQTAIVVRPKSETSVFPLFVGQEVTVGLVRFRILLTKNSTSAKID